MERNSDSNGYKGAEWIDKANSNNSLFQKPQGSPLASYAAWLSKLSLGALEKELQTVKEKEKQFYKLNHQLKLLQKKSKIVSDESRKLYPEKDTEDDEIAQLKAEIEGVNNDIKNIADQAKLVKNQSHQSKHQLKLLEDQLEKAKSQNHQLLDQINQKKQQLFHKITLIQEIKEAELQTHKKMTDLRQQIRSLEQECQLQENQLSLLVEQRQTKQKNKQKLQRIMAELEKEVVYQKDHERETHQKLCHLKSLKLELEHELSSLRKQQEDQILLYENKLQEYHSASLLSKQSQSKIRSIEDELYVVEKDLQELNLQFISEGELLKREESLNTGINEEFDSITKEALDVWNSICELVKIQEQQRDRDSDGNEIKFKALRVWRQIESIIQLNQHQ